MDKFQQIKAFNTAFEEYLQNPYGAQQQTTLQSNLEALQSPIDLDIFNPGSIISEQFFINLYKLTNMLDANDPLIWCGLNVLRRVCENPLAKHALIHTHNFASNISRFLSLNLAVDETLTILKLLQQLTYGIKIYENEIYLLPLFQTLTHFITNSRQENIRALSLEIATNLCYKNPPAIYTFTNYTSVRQIIKTLSKRQSNNSRWRFYWGKFLLTIEKSPEKISSLIIRDFVEQLFSSLVIALKQNENEFVENITTFFEDMKENEHTRKILTTYSKYSENVKEILQQLNSKINTECSATIMDFFGSLVKFRIPALIPLYPEFITIAMKLVTMEKPSLKALTLIKTLLVYTKKSKIFFSLIAELSIDTLIALLSLDNSERNNREINLRITELIQIIQEIIKVQDCKGQVIELLNENMVREWFSPILDNKENFFVENWLENYLENPIIPLYVHVLVLTSDLTMENSNWRDLFSELMKNKQIQMMIALAIFTQETEVKQKCFELLSAVGLSQDTITSIANYMRELEPFILIQNRSGIVAGIRKNMNSGWLDTPALITFEEQEKLYAALETLENLQKGDQVQNLAVSQVIQLYSVELHALKEVEKKTQNDLEQAINRATLIQQRLALISSEINRCRTLYFCCQEKSDKLQTKLRKMQTNIESSEKTNSMQIQENQNLKQIVSEKSSRVEQLSARILQMEEEYERKIKQLKEDNIAAEKFANERNRELEKLVEETAGDLKKTKQSLKTKEHEFEALQLSSHQQKQEKEDYIKQCRLYGQTLLEKEETIKKLSEELKDYAHMRDMIIQVAAKKREINDTA